MVSKILLENSILILDIVVVLSAHGDATGETNCPVVKGALFHLDKKKGGGGGRGKPQTVLNSQK